MGVVTLILQRPSGAQPLKVLIPQALPQEAEYFSPPSPSPPPSFPLPPLLAPFHPDHRLLPGSPCKLQARIGSLMP